MKVRKLIEELSKQDPEAEVYGWEDVEYTSANPIREALSPQEFEKDDWQKRHRPAERNYIILR